MRECLGPNPSQSDYFTPKHCDSGMSISEMSNPSRYGNAAPNGNLTTLLLKASVRRRVDKVADRRSVRSWSLGFAERKEEEEESTTLETSPVV